MNSNRSPNFKPHRVPRCARARYLGTYLRATSSISSPPPGPYSTTRPPEKYSHNRPTTATATADTSPGCTPADDSCHSLVHSPISRLASIPDPLSAAGQPPQAWEWNDRPPTAQHAPPSRHALSHLESLDHSVLLPWAHRSVRAGRQPGGVSRRPRTSCTLRPPPTATVRPHVPCIIAHLDLRCSNLISHLHL